jgi:hypothetical protein
LQALGKGADDFNEFGSFGGLVQIAAKILNKVEIATHNVGQEDIPLRTGEYQHRAHFAFFRVPNSDAAVLEFPDLYAITVVSASGTLPPGCTGDFGPPHPTRLAWDII